MVAVDRLLIVTSSPRLPAGLLTWPAWEALRSGPVHALDPTGSQAEAVRAAGVDVQEAPGGGDAAAFRELARDGRTAVWLAGPDGDPEFAAALADLVAADPDAELETVAGSWDPPGARLLDVVAVMDRLRSPGGCPWDAEQTHQSLAPYLLEEAYEAARGDRAGRPGAPARGAGRRAAAGGLPLPAGRGAAGAERFSVDDVAADLVAKLVRRHPHVFAGREVDRRGRPGGELGGDQGGGEAARVGHRRGAARPARAGTRGQAAAPRARRPASTPTPPTGDDLGARLFALVGEAVAAGEDPEAALRATARAYRDAVRAAEGAPAADG